MAAKGRRRNRRRKGRSLSPWKVVGAVVVGGLVVGAGALMGHVLRPPEPAGPPGLAAAEVFPPTTASAALALPPTAAYPDKQRDRASPWGCAAFDVDDATPAALAGPEVAVTLAGPGYRRIGGAATDTVVPDLDLFTSCLEQGQPAHRRTEPAPRSISPPARATAFRVGPLRLQAQGPEGAVRLALEVARSRPDPSPYLEAAPTQEPFGAVWLFQHGNQPLGGLQVRMAVAAARCVEPASAPGAAPLFRAERAAEPLTVLAPAGGDGPRRRRYDVSALAAAVPAGAAALTRARCRGAGCENPAAFRARHAELAAAGYCDMAGGVWRLQVDGEAMAPNPANPARPYVQRFTVLTPLEPALLERAGPVYAGPQNAALTLQPEAAAPYAFAADLPAGAGGTAQFAVAAPQTSAHLMRVVAYDAAGRPMGQSRWLHVLTFTPQGAGPALVAAAPPASTPASPPASAPRPVARPTPGTGAAAPATPPLTPPTPRPAPAPGPTAAPTPAPSNPLPSPN